MKHVRPALLVLFLVSVLFLPSPRARAGERLFLVHAKTAMKLDDAQVCAVPNVVMAALAKGYRVVVLFDASGVTLVRRGGLFGGDRTPLDKARLPERERRTLAAQFGLAPGDVPRDYGAYFHELARRGVRLVANRTMMLLYKIGEDEIDPGVKPVSLSEMAALFAQADVYVAY